MGALILSFAPHVYDALHKYDYYQSLAPSGWHTVVPLNSDDSGSYAVSPDVPGLTLTCGFKTCSRSHDAGKTWQQIKTPSTGDLTAPPGGNGTFFLADIQMRSTSHLWVSHDAGSTWTQLHPKASDWLQYGATGFSLLSLSFYRHGKLYNEGGYASADSPQARQFVVSYDDRQTWSHPEKQPSSAEQHGWVMEDNFEIDRIAPDYRAPHAWFRILANAKQPSSQPALLERSGDDGQSWSSIGLIGNNSFGRPQGGLDALATTPFQPNELCIAEEQIIPPDNGISTIIYRSTNAGTSWQAALLPTDPTKTDGTIGNNVQIDQTGNCYVQTYRAVWELPRNSLKVDRILNTTSFIIGSLTPSFTYMPAGNGLSSRLFVYGFSNVIPNIWEGDYLGNDYLLLWRSAG